MESKVIDYLGKRIKIIERPCGLQFYGAFMPNRTRCIIFHISWLVIVFTLFLFSFTIKDDIRGKILVVLSVLLIVLCFFDHISCIGICLFDFKNIDYVIVLNTLYLRRDNFFKARVKAHELLHARYEITKMDTHANLDSATDHVLVEVNWRLYRLQRYLNYHKRQSKRTWSKL